MRHDDYVLEFPPFRLEPEAGRVWRGEDPVDLRPKAWHLLRYLAERPGRLLSKDELLDAVWDDALVGDGNLSQTIRELRVALGDDAREPRWIETVHRRGYRFIATVLRQPASGMAQPSVFALPMGGRGDRLFGRQSELDRLGKFLEAARAGSRQLVFITGDPGIGKTSLIRSFLEQRIRHQVSEPVLVAGGHCVELRGEGEAYLPVLDALERLLRDVHGGSLRQLLRTYAPSWLAQFPWLEEPAGPAETVPRPGTPARMLRELNIALEAISAERLVVLWLEDLHWSDPATIDLLGAMALRSEPARLLILASYRPVDASMHDHPVAPMKRRLAQQGACHELSLGMLDESAVREYLVGRFESADPDPGLVSAIHNVTDGNPLFLVTLADHMVAQGVMPHEGESWNATNVGDVLRAMSLHSFRDIVTTQLEGMTREEVEAIEAASVAGESFDAQSVAAALDTENENAEAICARLSDWGRFLTNVGPASWPDGSEGQRFRFLHDTLRAIVYDRVTAARRRSFHERIARRMEMGYDSNLGPVVAELALHHERGGNVDRAVHFLALAAQGVKRRFANREAVAYLDRALALLTTLPDAPERAGRELEIRILRGRALLVAAPYTGCEQFDNAARMRELSKQLASPDIELLSLAYQSNLTTIQGDVTAARSLVEEARVIARDVSNPVLLAHPPVVSGMIALLAGDLDTSETEFAQVRSLTDGHEVNAETIVRQGNPGLLAQAFSTWSAWLRGFPGLARRRAATARDRARLLGDPLGMVATYDITLTLDRFCRDEDATRSGFAEMNSLVDDLGIVYPYTPRSATEGWLLIRSGEIDEAVERLQRGIEVARAENACYALSILLGTLAEAALVSESPARGLEVIAESLAYVDESGERLWEAELHRLSGELLRLEGEVESAERSFGKSLEVARRQGALALELRTAESLAKLLRDTDRPTEGRSLLTGVYDRLEEGLDTAGVRDARALLESL